MARAVSLVQVPDHLEDITDIDTEREVEPETVGMSRESVASIWRAVQQLYRTGTHPAISLCVRRHGKIVLNRAIGHASGNGPDDPPDAPRVPCGHDTPFCIYSASKAITAMLIHLLDDRGVLHVDDRVVEYVPEFAAHGKEWVTIRHVLTHRAGLPSIPGDQTDVQLLYDWDEVVRLLCDARPVSAPGRRLAYHAITGGFILGEVIARASGVDIRTLLAREILDPLGFRWSNYGVAPEDIDKVARSAFTGPEVVFPLSHVVKRALGVSAREAAEVSNHEAWLTSIVPSGNVVSTAEEASRFFQLLLDDGEMDGKKIFDARTIHRAVTETAYREVDFTLMFPVRYGVGLMLGSDVLSLFGPGMSRAFGHLGFMNNFVYADPERDISVGLLNSGKPFGMRHMWPLFQVLWSISSGCRRVR